MLTGTVRTAPTAYLRAIVALPSRRSTLQAMKADAQAAYGAFGQRMLTMTGGALRATLVRMEDTLPRGTSRSERQ